MKRDEAFKPERFTDPNYIEESSLSDRKSQIPRIWSADKQARAEFVRDVIALANASRQRGEPGYLLFGIDDDWRIVGIEGQSVREDLPQDYDPNDNRQVEKLQRDFNEKAFNNTANEYIAPSQPILAYYHGIVNGVRVSYLEICAEPSHEGPYEVGTSISSEISEGECWVRRGESKKIIPEDEKRFIYAWTDMPLIKRKDCLDYLNGLAHLSGPSPQTIIGYQDLSTSQHLLVDEVSPFIDKVLPVSLLVIEGNAGCGKTVFLKDQVRRLARNLIQELKTIPEDEWLDDLQNPIPVFLDLNSFVIRSEENFARKLLEMMEGKQELGLYRGNKPEKIFKDESKQWIIFLDGFDEAYLSHENRGRVWGAIREVIGLYPNVRVIVTMRPCPISRTIEYGRLIQIEPLSQEQIIDYLTSQLAQIDSTRLQEILDFFNTEEDLWSHLQYPLFLGTAANYLGGQEELIDTVDPSVYTEPKNRPVESEQIEEEPKTDKPFNRQPIIDYVNKQLNDEARLPLSPSDMPESFIKADEEVEEPLKLGKFLHQIFQRLWAHNHAKKQRAGFNCGRWEDAFENLGEMAAKNPTCEQLRRQKAKEYLSDKLDCMLDLGLLIQPNIGVCFPTFLSKTYFAAFFLDILLRLDQEELNDLIHDPVCFWEKCLQLIQDFSDGDVTILEKRIKILEGE